MPGLLALSLAVGLVAPAPRPDPQSLGVQTPKGPDGVQLRRTPGGGFRHRDREAGFEATIHPDGRVTFRNLARGSIETNVSPDDDGNVESLLRGPYSPEPRFGDETGNAEVDFGPYGTPAILFKCGVRAAIPGLADMMAKRGRITAKRAFLEQTEDLRARLARSADTERVREALVRLPERLLAVWGNDALTYAERRAIVFELWDEADEVGPEPAPSPGVSFGAASATLDAEPAADSAGWSSLDADARRQTAGERARRRIETFIAKVAPPGSVHAFTPSELERLNARRLSRQRFDPYRSVDHR